MATDLHARFYADVVAGIVRPWAHAAARIGAGSDVLGFDDARSSDHGWGPQVVVLVADADVRAVTAAVEDGLPDSFDCWPVRFSLDGSAPARHHVQVASLAGWFDAHLGGVPVTAVDWLWVPQQRLLEATGGAVLRDDIGLGAMRSSLAWYPDQVWRWLLACQWRRIAQSEAFVGRSAEVGDELGSRLVTARLVRELMRLWFLCCRTYWPYEKWFGSAFALLPGASALAPLLSAAVAGSDPSALPAAYEVAAKRSNALGLTAEVDPGVRPYHQRPYPVLMADRFTEAFLEGIDDPSLLALPLAGSVDQAVDSTDLLTDPGRLRPRR